MGRNKHLLWYVQCEYEEEVESFEGLPRTRPKLLYNALLDALHAVFLVGERDATLVATFSWFFFDVVCKSISLNLHRAGKLEIGGAQSRADRVGADSMKFIEKLVLVLGQQVRARTWLTGPLVTAVNMHVALFLKDLLSLVDRGWCMDLISRYLECLQPPARGGEERLFLGMRWKVLRIVADHPHYVALNLPIPKKIQQASNVLVTFCRNHFLAGLLLRSMRSCIESDDAAVRQYASTVIREIIRKHDSDTRYKTPLLQKRLCRIYFPYILVLVENLELLQRVDMAERRDWLLPVLWILKHSNRKTVLQKWWCGETTMTQTNFLHLLLLCVKAFDYSPSLSYACDSIVVDVLEPFMMDLQEGLKGTKSFLDELWGVFSAMLAADRQTGAPGRPQVVLCLFESLRVFIHVFSEQLFVNADLSSYCGDLAFQILQYCNVAHGQVRAGATALLYLLMRTNFRVRGNFARMKLQATIAVSKLQVRGDQQVLKTAHLESSLDAVAKRAQEEFGGVVTIALSQSTTLSTSGVLTGAMFAAQVKHLAQTLFRVIRDSAKMQEYRHDHERMCDYMYQVRGGLSLPTQRSSHAVHLDICVCVQVSLGYAMDSPDLRLTWLSNLADFHLASRNYEEHAQCKLLAAALVCQFLHLKVTLWCFGH